MGGLPEGVSRRLRFGGFRVVFLLAGLVLSGPGVPGSGSPLLGAQLLEAQEVDSAPALSLEEAVAIAREGSPLINLARTDLERAANEVGLGAAGYLPQLSLDAGGNRTVTNSEQTFIDQDPRRLRDATTRQFGAGATLRWRAFDGGGRRAGLSRARSLETGERFALEDVEGEILTGVVVAYHDLVRLQSQLELLGEAVELSEERLRIAEVRREVGAASDLEVRQAQVDRNADRAEVIRARSDLAAARAEFNHLLGRSPTTAFSVRDEIPVDPGLDREEIRERARARNPAAQEAGARLLAAREGQREARADWFPSLDLQAGLDFTDLSSESGFQQAVEGYDYTFGFTLSYDLFDGFARNRQGEEARLQARSAELTLFETESRVEAEVEIQFARYQDQLELVELERENEEIARRNVGTALEQFRLGTIASIELREVQEALTRAGTRLLESEFGARVAEARLLRLAGEPAPGG